MPSDYGYVDPYALSPVHVGNPYDPEDRIMVTPEGVRDALPATVEYLTANGWEPEWEVVVAAPNHLQLDYDDYMEHAAIPAVKRKQFDDGIEMLRRRFGGPQISYSVWLSKSGNHVHVQVELPEDITDQERISWQVILGSDPKREAMNLMRVANGVLNPILLFQRKNRTGEKITIPALPESPDRKLRI